MLTNTIPNFISPVFEPIIVRLFNPAYEIGNLFYCTVFAVPEKNLCTNGSKANAKEFITLKSNGDGTGHCTFDLSNVLQSLVRSYAIPEDTIFYKDESCFHGYYIQTGTIDLTTKQQVQDIETDVLFVVRATKDLPSVNFTDHVGYLTNQPDFSEVRLAEDNLLSILLPLDNLGRTDYTLRLKANKYYSDNTITTGQTISTRQIFTGGIYTYNVKPEVIEPDPEALAKLTRYDVWLDYTDSEQFTATATYTASCPAGFTGSYTATATASSTISLADAQATADAQALAQAEENLVCTPYTETNEVNLVNGGYNETDTEYSFNVAFTASEAKEAPYTLLYSVDGVQASLTMASGATVAAQYLTYDKTAEAQTIVVTLKQGDMYLVGANDSFTVTIPALGSSGGTTEITWQPVYSSNGCFAFQMQDSADENNTRVSTEEENEMYYTATNNEGLSCPTF